MLTKGYDICDLVIMPSSTEASGPDPFGIEHIWADCAESSPNGGLILVPSEVDSPALNASAPSTDPGDGREMEGFEPPQVQAEAGNAANAAFVPAAMIAVLGTALAVALHMQQARGVANCGFRAPRQSLSDKDDQLYL
eukprot:TRINITY_DN10072_c0_g1_i1.p2 TRINITY_DN10072_c0_g1~~TRINITY_DN10072_c0_g1_i1.p2  ORF type:complete len:138 (-),score=30.43 TRINITY_DN10072_c0_g1_i1:374-787(-)